MAPKKRKTTAPVLKLSKKSKASEEKSNATETETEQARPATSTPDPDTTQQYTYEGVDQGEIPFVQIHLDEPVVDGARPVVPDDEDATSVNASQEQQPKGSKSKGSSVKADRLNAPCK